MGSKKTFLSCLVQLQTSAAEGRSQLFLIESLKVRSAINFRLLRTFLCSFFLAASPALIFTTSDGSPTSAGLDDCECRKIFGNSGDLNASSVFSLGGDSSSSFAVGFEGRIFKLGSEENSRVELVEEAQAREIWDAGSTEDKR